MTKETVTLAVVCDCCEKPLVKRLEVHNNGTYQEDYLELGTIDLCFICAGKIFEINIKSKINDNKLKEWVQNLRYKENRQSVDLIKSLSDLDPIKNLEDL